MNERREELKKQMASGREWITATGVYTAEHSQFREVTLFAAGSAMAPMAGRYANLQVELQQTHTQRPRLRTNVAFVCWYVMPVRI